jgi:nicotinamidase-related amidase
MKLDPKKTAILTLDIQKGVFPFAPASESIVPNAAKAVEMGRKNHFHIIHVGLGFAEGHPEIPDFDFVFKKIKDNNLFVIGSPTAEFHKSLVQPKDLVIYKHRVGAFSENQLQLVLRSKGVENLVFFGISTSGIVLSTIRRAFDLDFRCTILKDACFDPDPEVHRILTEKVFLSQATVLTVDEFIAAQG